MKDTAHDRLVARRKRKVHVRKRVAGTPERPRLTVFRSHRAIYAQVIDDRAGRTLAAADSRVAVEVEVPEGLTAKQAAAYRAGNLVAQRSKAQGITRVVFDRNGYLYHGRVAALARGARDGGLEF